MLKQAKPYLSVHVTQSVAPETILMEESLIKRHGIPKAQHITIQFGIYKQVIKVLPSTKKNGLYMHSRLAQLLGIPLLKRELMLTTSYLKDKAILKLGPLLAVMINKEIPEDIERPFGAISSFCFELTEACNRYGALVYFFTPQSLLQRHSLIQGWVHDGQWKKLNLPLPEVIYNRLPTRQAENQPEVRNLINEICKTRGISIFNERFLNKHEVFQALAPLPKVSTYLPHSELLSNYDQLKKLLEQYSTVYIKPIQGSSGKGILRVTMCTNQTFLLERTSQVSGQMQRYESLKKLYKQLLPLLKRRTYQVQQGLNVIQVGQKPVDFRALVQKNSLGIWQLTSIVARTAGNEQFVANIARGGTIEPVLNNLPHTNLMQHVSHEKLYQNMKEVALLIASSLDEQLDEHFAEFGVDLAVDTQGKIWLIEVNSKPSKIYNTNVTKKTRPSIRMLLEYTKYLTGFQKGITSHGKNDHGHTRHKN